MAKHRTARIAEEIKRELSQMIRDDVKDQRVQGLISITSVEAVSYTHLDVYKRQLQRLVVLPSILVLTRLN